MQERYSGIVVQQMLFLQIQSSWNQRVVAFFDRNFAPSSQTPSSWAHKVSAVVISLTTVNTRPQQRQATKCVVRLVSKVVVVFSLWKFVYSPVAWLFPSGMVATQTCTRTRTTKTQSLSTLRHSQLKRRSWVLALRTWPSNLQLYLPIRRSTPKLKSTKPQ